MITLSIDIPSATLVVIDNAGPSTRDAEFERTLEAMSLVTQRRPGILPAIVIYIDPGRSIPDARWRRRFAHERASAGPFRGAMVTASIAHRGLMTAIDWIRPPGAEQRMLAFPNLPRARAWLEFECQRTLEPIPRLYAEARSQAHQAAAQRL